MNNTLFARFVLGLGILLTSLLSYAQETTSTMPTSPAALGQTIAPLVDAQTTLILHINLQAVNLDKLIYELMVFTEKTPGAGMRSADQAAYRRSVLQKNLAHVFRDTNKMRARLVKEVGLNDLFLLAYRDLEDVSFVIAAPIEGTTPEQRKAFARIIRSQYPILLGAQGFMLGAAPAAPILLATAETNVKEKMKDFRPVAREFLNEAFAVNNTATLTLIGISHDGEPSYIDQIPSMFHFPPSMMEIGRKAAKTFLWTSIGIDFNTLTVNMVGEAPTEQEAENVRNEVNQAFAQLIPTEGSSENEKIRTPEQRLAFLKAYEPIQKGKRLTVTLSQSNTDALSFVVVPLMFGLNVSMQTAWGHQCSQNLLVISQAIQKYREEHGAYPPAWTTDSEGRPLHSWRVLILPYLGEEELYAQIALDEPWNGPLNRQLHTKMPLYYRCPSNPSTTDSTTTYTLIVGDAAFPEGPEQLKEEDMTDAKTATVLVTERRTPVSWMQPDEVLLENANFDHPRGIGSHHGNPGINTVFFDGTVRYILRQVRPNILRAMLTSRGGEVFDLPRETVQ